MGDRNTGIDRDQLKDYTLKRQDISPDGLVWQEPVIDKDLTTPPGSPSEDNRYLIISGAFATDWAGHDNDIAHYHGGQWNYYTPIEGWFVWINDENKLYRFNGTSWAEFVRRSLTEDTIVNLDNSMTATEIQALINAQPKDIEEGIQLTFIFANGTYTLDATLTFEGFMGAGELQVKGENGITSLHTNQGVHLDFSGSVIDGMVFDSCHVAEVEGRDLKISTAGAVSCVEVAKCNYTTFAGFYVLGTVASQGFGFLTGRGGYTRVRRSYVDGLEYGVIAEHGVNAFVIDFTNSPVSGATLPNYGIRCHEGTLVGIEGAQPSGAISDTRVEDGGIIVDSVEYLDAIAKKHTQNTDDKIIEGDSSVEVVDTSGETVSVRFKIDNTEQLRLIDGKLYPITDDDIVIGDSTHRIKELHLMPSSLYLGDTHITEAEYKANRDNIVLNAFRIAINGSLSQFNMVDGVVDEYEDETGIDTGASTNEDYDGTNDLYKPIVIASEELDYMEYSTNELAQEAYVTNGDAIYGSDFCTGGTATSDRDCYEGFEPDKAFDNNEGTSWSNLIGGSPDWLKYDLGVAVTKTVRKLRIYNHNGAVEDFILQGSNNDSNWDALLTTTAVDDTGWEEWTFSNTIAYRYYRLYVTSKRQENIQCEEMELMELSGKTLQSYSEDTIIQQGTYSLKGIALITDSLNDTLTKTLGSGEHIDLTDYNTIKLDVYASRTGTNLQIQIHDSGGTTSTKDIVISEADTWETTTWDISGISDANKDDIDSIIIKVINADAENTFYVDNVYAVGVTQNMTLISNDTEADTQPDEGRLVILEEDVDSITINTDIKAYVSRDDGTTWSQITLVDEGNFDSNKQILVASVDISGQPADKTMKYKIETLNNKELKIHGTAMLWN